MDSTLPPASFTLFHNADKLNQSYRFGVRSVHGHGDLNANRDSQGRNPDQSANSAPSWISNWLQPWANEPQAPSGHVPHPQGSPYSCIIQWVWTRFEWTPGKCSKEESALQGSLLHMPLRSWRWYMWYSILSVWLWQWRRRTRGLRSSRVNLCWKMPENDLTEPQVRMRSFTGRNRVRQDPAPVFSRDIWDG